MHTLRFVLQSKDGNTPSHPVRFSPLPYGTYQSFTCIKDATHYTTSIFFAPAGNASSPHRYTFAPPSGRDRRCLKLGCTPTASLCWSQCIEEERSVEALRRDGAKRMGCIGKMHLTSFTSSLHPMTFQSLAKRTTPTQSHSSFVSSHHLTPTPVRFT